MIQQRRQAAGVYFPPRNYRAEKAAAIEAERLARINAQGVAERLRLARLESPLRAPLIEALEEQHAETSRELEAAIYETGQD